MKKILFTSFFAILISLSSNLIAKEIVDEPNYQPMSADHSGMKKRLETQGWLLFKGHHFDPALEYLVLPVNNYQSTYRMSQIGIEQVSSDISSGGIYRVLSSDPSTAYFRSYPGGKENTEKCYVFERKR